MNLISKANIIQITADQQDQSLLQQVADIEHRVKRTIERNDVAPDKAEQAVNKADKARANYYSFYSGKKWGRPENYDLCLNTSNLTTEQCVDIIVNYLKIKNN